MQKFFVETNQIKQSNIEILGEDVNHIANVLRLQKEDEIIICNKDENISYQTKITRIEKEKITCQIIQKIEETTESNIHVTIFQGLPKADKMEYIIQKSTELGVRRIVPVAMTRSIVKISGKDEKKKIERWNKIAEVAAKQSKRDIIPEVSNIQNICQITDEINKFDLFLIAYENEKETTLKSVLETMKNKEEIIRIGIVIGPEGGIEGKEVKTLQEKGAKVITLGNRILRTETASLCILSNIMYELEIIA